MVKSYLRYEACKTFGVITSSLSNVVFSGDDKLAIAPALEDVALWDLKKGILVCVKLFLHYSLAINLIFLY
jgi:U3 small nucleolar RNA-associated protein 12